MMSKLYILFGYLKGSFISVKNRFNIKSTKILVRKSFFNIFINYFKNLIGLDLFCGSGIVGFECLSLGAKLVVFNDFKLLLVDNVFKNITRLNVCYFSMVFCFCYFKLLSYNCYYDFIIIDPPFFFGFQIISVLEISLLRLRLNGIVYLEGFLDYNLLIFITQRYNVLKFGFLGKVFFFVISN